MQEPSVSPDISQAAEKTPPTISQGYCIKLYVKPDGSFSVGDPEPTEQESSDTNASAEPDEAQEPHEAKSGSEADEYESLPDLATALKHIMAVVKEHPIEQNPETSFEAGFAE